MKFQCYSRGELSSEGKQIEIMTRVSLLQATREKDAALKQSVLNFWLEGEQKSFCLCIYLCVAYWVLSFNSDSLVSCSVFVQLFFHFMDTACPASTVHSLYCHSCDEKLLSSNLFSNRTVVTVNDAAAHSDFCSGSLLIFFFFFPQASLFSLIIT